MIWAFKTLICSQLILVAASAVNMFPVQPFIKRTAVVKYAIYNNFHPTLVNLFNKLCKINIACLQISSVCNSVNISCRMSIVMVTRCKNFSFIRDYHCNMWIYIIIILYIIFMIRRRYKQRIKVNNIYSEIFKIIQLIPYALQISTVEFPDTHRFRILIPILYFIDMLSYIIIFIIKYIVLWSSISKSIHKYLVHDSTLSPRRNLVSRYYTKIIILVKLP